MRSGIKIQIAAAALAGLILVLPSAVFSGSAGGVAALQGAAPQNKAQDARDRDNPSVFAGERKGFDLEAYREGEVLRMSGRRVDEPVVSFSDMMASKSHPAARRVSYGGKRRVAISILASAILPGLGELYLYFDTRDKSILPWFPLFMGMDAYFWYGYKTNNDKGLDYQQQYKDYCDEHWSEERFLELHPWCAAAPRYGCDSWEEYNAGAIEFQQFFFIYVPKSQDPEEYYENCGKYNAFAFGWDDWDPLVWDGSYEQFKELAWTPHRTYYWSLRVESDKYFARSDRHAMLLIVNRVVSMIDAGWLAYRANSRARNDETGWRLEIKPGFESPTVGISYRF